MRPCLCALVCAFVATCPSTALAADPGPWRTLDGSLNNKEHPHWGKAGATYPRRAPANYADRRGKPVTGPSPRYVSNRIFSDTSQNLFSENGVTQWGAVWGQFLDHTFGLRQETGGERGAARLSTPPIRSRRSATTSARSPSNARPRRPGRAPRPRASS